MEKNKLKLALIVVLFVFLGVSVFAEEVGAGVQNGTASNGDAPQINLDTGGGNGSKSGAGEKNDDKPLATQVDNTGGGAGNPKASGGKDTGKSAPQNTFSVTFYDENKKQLFVKSIASGQTLSSLSEFGSHKPKDTNSEFKGWFPEPGGGGKEYKGDYKIKANQKLYAYCPKVIAQSPDANKAQSLEDGQADSTIDSTDTSNPGESISNVPPVENQKEFINENLFLPFDINGVFALLLIGLAVLNFCFMLIKCKRNSRMIEAEFVCIKEEFAKLNKVNTQNFNSILSAQNRSKEIGQQNIPAQDNSVLIGKLNDLTGHVMTLINDVQYLKNEKKIADGISTGNLDPLDIFNGWAANPSSPLPKAFYYIEGNMKILVKLEIKECNTENKWIVNRDGQKKYLFPNPNLFDQMTDITELYTMELGKLKPKGQNKIKITEPCEISNGGVVEFAGKLEIL